MLSTKKALKIESKKTLKKFLFYPDNLLMLLCKIFNFIFITICLIAYPLYINFRIDDTKFTIFMILIELTYIVDFLIGFNLAYRTCENSYED